MKNLKNKNNHRALHPVHWHVSMFVAIAAILLTTLKDSGEMIRALQMAPVNANFMTAVYQRNAENLHLPVILANGVRHATVGSK
jgi:hypothetical protein